MSTQGEPWWASGAGPDDAIPPIDDPVLAHRAARRGDDEPADDEPAHDVGDGEAPGDAAPPGGERGAADPPGGAHGADVCGVCPICTAARVLGETRPELVAHLGEAARHLAAAVRTLLDDDDARRPSSEDDDRVTRIDLD